MPIPLPPPEIQKKIVEECKKVDDEVEKAEKENKQLREEIREIINNVDGEMVKLGEVAMKISDSFNPRDKHRQDNIPYIGLENIESNSGLLIGDILTNYQGIKSTKTIFKKYDILYGKLRPNLNKVYLSEMDGICSTDIMVLRFKNKNLAKIYKYYFLSQKFNYEVLKSVSGVQLPRTSWNKMKSLKIPLPPLQTQKEIVSKIEKLETKIKQNQTIIDSAKSKKEEILNKYLL